MNYIYFISGYLLIINIIAVVVTVKDKLNAVKHKKRTSEIALLFIAISGGGIGMYISMITVRHKTKRRKFMIGIPVIVIIEAMLAVTFYNMVRYYV